MDLKAIIKDYKVCKDVLQIPTLAGKLRPLIESVKLPPSLKTIDKAKRPLKLEQSSPEFRLRFQYLEECLGKTDVGKKIGDFDNFCGEFRDFLEDRTLVNDKILEDAYGFVQDSGQNDENGFVHKARIEVVVLRTSQNYVSVISLDGSEELLLEVDREFVGLGIKVRTGDVISVVNPKLTSKQGRHLDPELQWRYKVYTHEVNDFLDQLKARDDACTLLEDFLRSRAVWKYVLNVSVKEEENQREICKIILEVCQKISSIASTSPMTGTIRNFWTSFEGSKFFNDVLPRLVQDDAWQRESVELVKKFLENLLEHLPTCGVIASEIVKRLNSQSTGMDREFMTKLFSILALNVSGVKDNPKHLKWNQQSVIPVASELLTTATNWRDLPHVKVVVDEKEKKKGSSAENVYSSAEEYIRTYYTLMREECFHKLKNGINYFLWSGKFDPKDIMMYRVHLVKALPSINQSIQELGLTLVFEFKNKKTDESDDPDNSNWLMFGNLLCLSFDGTFQCPVWGIISGDSEDTKDGKTHVQVSLCSERNKLSDAKVITKLQQLEDQGFSAYMVESNTFYRAYGPPLEVLQQKETVPFEEQLVQVQKCTDQPPEYLKNLKKCPDWSIIFNNPSCIELKVDDYSYELLIQEFKKLRENEESDPKLDEKQLDAVEQALRNKVTLIQGPPGTGKSYVGEALLELLLSMEVPEDNGPILVVTYKNHALDNFLETCERKNPGFLDNLVRVGRGSDDASENLKKRRIFELFKKSGWDDCYHTSQRLKQQLEATKPLIEKCVKSLRCSNKFTVSVFIKEADDKHLLHLSSKPEYAARMKEILNDKNFRVKHFKELCKMIDEPLRQWLPKKRDFEKFAGKVTEEGLESCSDEDYGIVDESNKGETKDEDCNTLQSLPSDERQERRADYNDEQDEGNKSTDNDTSSLTEETALIVLPEIPDEKLGNVRTILNAGDIQKLKDHEKIQMVYALQRQRYKAVTNEFLELTQDFTQKQQRRKEIYDQRQIKILKKHNVIGMTVSGAAIRASWLESIKPSVMIVEEAAEILESQLVAVISSSVQHLVMIGDHQQLRPQVHYDILCRKCHFHISMFERLIKGGLDYATLNKQGRMRDEIAELVRKLDIYKEYETRKEVVETNKVLDCLSKPMFFYDHSKEEKTQHGSHSMYNEHEADVVVQVAKYLVCDNKVEPGRITVLCSYRGQVQHLKKKLAKQDAYRLSESDITVTTIDSFQGKENDIILLSLVRSKQGTSAKIGYLSSMNRICVAISRARTGLYLFGNTHLLKKKSQRGWGIIINHMAKEGLVGRSIEALIGGANAADGPSTGPIGAQPGNQSPGQKSLNIMINNPGMVSIGDNNKIAFNVGVPDGHQLHGRLNQQQSTPSSPPQENQPSQEGQRVEETSKQNRERQPVEETSKQNQETQPVEETNKHDTSSSPIASGNQLNSPSTEEREGQEMSWIGDPHPSAVETDGRTNLSPAAESEAQEMSWTGDPQPSGLEADGSPNVAFEDEGETRGMSLIGAEVRDVDPQPSVTEADGRSSQETGEDARPVQDTHLPKRQEQEEKEEDDKVQSVEETSEGNKGQLVVGAQSDVPSLSGDVKASGEDVSSSQQDSHVPLSGRPLDEKREDDKVQSVEETTEGNKGQLVVGTQSDVPSSSDDVKATGVDVSSSQQDSNVPFSESPLDEKRERKIFDDKEACILHKTLQEAPDSAVLITKLQNLQVSNPESLGDIKLDNQELTIGEIKEKLRSDAQEILDQYLDQQGCNCDECGSLR